MTEICWSGDAGVDCPQPDAGGIEKSGIPLKRFLDNQTWLEDYLQLEAFLSEIQLQMVDDQRLCISITEWFQSLSLLSWNSLPSRYPKNISST